MASLPNIINSGLEFLTRKRLEFEQVADANITEFEVRQLLASALGIELSKLYQVSKLTAAQQQDYETLLLRRASGEPLQHILGVIGFHEIDLKVDSRALIPRSETELLVEVALKSWTNLAQPKTVIDIGVGSGAILFALRSAVAKSNFLHNETIWIGIDNSAEALELCQENAKLLKLESEVILLKADCLAAIQPTLCKQPVLIVSNPPYIPKNQILSVEVSEFEPHSALFAGEDGFAEIQKILAQAKLFLKGNAQLVLEIGQGQASRVESMALDSSLQVVEVHRDLHDIERVLVIKALN